MVNYILSFCKITAASRIFARNFYLPLLKPQTPREALRTFRITGKWLLGAKIQHYIPVLLNHKRKRSKKAKNYGQSHHEQMDDYTYMTPVLDPENESHKILLSVLEGKGGNGVFVYTVEDKRYNIVLQAAFEIAIRDGDVIDMLISQNTDKVIVKMRDFKKIPMEIQYYDGGDEDNMFRGEGATTEDEEQFHHHGKYTMSLAKIFEDKERAEEEWEEALRRIMRRKRKQRFENSKEYKAMIKETMRKFDWEKFEEDAKKIIEEISEPATEEPIEMEIDDLEKTKKVNEIFSEKEDLLNQLPTMKEISDVIRCMGSATLTEIDDDGEEYKDRNKRRVSGVKVKLSSGKECFVSGQMVHTDEGEVFVPGQTVENDHGVEYAPGITINVNNKPTLISGLIMGEEQKDPMFLPQASTITADGQLTFATVEEERPPPPTEEEKIVKQAKREERRRKKMIEEGLLITDTLDDKSQQIEEPEDKEEISEMSSPSDNEDSSIELNNSVLEELDIETIRLKQEQQQAEIAQLKLFLMNDGMDEIIATLEEKKESLRRKLEELRKLSLTSENSLVSFATDSDATEIASKISQNQETINRMADILITIVRKCCAFRDKNSVKAENIHNCFIISEILTETDERFNCCSNKVKILLKSIFSAANDVYKSRPKDQILALNTVGDILADTLKQDHKTLQELIELLNTPLERNEICNTVFRNLIYDFSKSKTNTIRLIANSNVDLPDKIEKLLDKDGETLSNAFNRLMKTDPDIATLVIQNVCKQLENIKTDEDAKLVMEQSIINSVKTKCNQTYKNALENDPNLDELLNEANSLATALAQTSSEYPTPLHQNPNTEQLIMRTLLIKDLADKDYSLKTAFNRLKKNPEAARSDPRIRQLIRESAVLTPIPSQIRNSRDIPLQLLKSQNFLAMEDYLAQRSKIPFPVLISRGTMQAVIPKEAARGVLAGRVPYVLIDESGVTNFKPMHMFGAMNLSQNREKMIGDYLSVSGRDRSRERSEDKSFLQAKNNVRKLKKILNSNHRQVA